MINNYLNLSEENKKSLIKEKLVKYLPSFIDVNSFALNIILNSIVTVIKNLYENIYLLNNSYWSGKGLRLTADEYRIFYKQSHTDLEIQEFLKKRFEILSQRGTEAGIATDLQSLDLKVIPQIEYRSGAGWILDENYPETDSMIWLDAEKVIKLNFSYIGTLGSAILGVARLGDQYYNYIKNYTKIIKEFIIPIDVSIIYE